jgi:hypothetical protein
VTTVTLDGIPFTRRDGGWTWGRSSPVPAAWTEILDALYFGMYEQDARGHLALATTGAKVYVALGPGAGGEPDARGVVRVETMMLPATALGGRVTRATTGTLDGERIVCVF